VCQPGIVRQPQPDLQRLARHHGRALGDQPRVEVVGAQRRRFVRQGGHRQQQGKKKDQRLHQADGSTRQSE
jgi:hypothetical protein